MENGVMIITNRLLLRKFEEDDWSDLYEYLSDDTVIKYEPYPVFSREQAIDEAKRRAGDERFYAVCLKDTLKVIGNLFLEKKDYDCYEIGYVFSRKFQGQGYAIEASKALLNYLFLQKNARRVIAECNPKNERSWNLLENLKMRREAYFHKNIYFKIDESGEPIWCDTYLYALLREEWDVIRKSESK